MKHIKIYTVLALVAIAACIGIHKAKADTINAVSKQAGGTILWTDTTGTNSTGFSNGVPVVVNGSQFNAGLTTNMLFQSFVFSTGLHPTNTLVIKNGLIVGVTSGP